MSYSEFIRLEVNHAYREGPCPDVAFVIPSDTHCTLKRGRMLVRRGVGVLTLSGDPIVVLDQSVLRFGVRVDNPHFENFTELPPWDEALPWDPRQRVHLYRNAAAPNTLTRSEPKLVGSTPAFTLEEPRPVTVVIHDAKNHVVEPKIEIEDDRTEVSCDFRTLAPGRYTLGRTHVDKFTNLETTINTSFYLDPELRAAGCRTIVEIELNAGVYARKHNTWNLSFDARSDHLSYWVVAKGLTSELDKLQVSDKGYLDDDRAQVTFDKRLPASFTPAEKATAARIRNGADVVLFRSAKPIARSQKPLRKLQLSRNGDVVVPNLPLPGPERATAEMIIHLTKP